MSVTAAETVPKRSGPKSLLSTASAPFATPTTGMPICQCPASRKRHRIVEKGSGKTNYIERFNNTLRQRLARLTRKTVAFSKKWANHLGAIWFFIHHYNASLPLP